ncbi:MAG: 16S rRNA (uracil(1498)-N(3))-methyltransferase [Pelagibacteraceae bacterium TMED124]|nr:16S rRNA (uracil(1498)-N(3))-methyltransferase [Candidatus Neomarinimicrobiota bacterium]RPG19315.1 MAG: 16S rRNA (uracil(1498)-N(3))-methyltransferase [Pelagibacteraceae bacterium TMED124]|tara:strand:- start:862 stop:1569 length:708 start_codon:yes stop_codon:yes gene_type:complete
MSIPFYGLKEKDLNLIYLSSIESMHCIKVLRHKIGDKIKVLDGMGHIYECEILDDNYNSCTVKIIKSDFIEKNKFNIHIAVAPPKSTDRLDWLVEKIVEMGAYKLTFIKTRRSIRKKVKIERLKKIAISSMKQSFNPYKIIIEDMIAYKDFILGVKEKQCVIPHIVDKKRLFISKALESDVNTCAIIGPEGDFTVDEVNLAVDNNFKTVSLGNRRLRTETAVISTIGAFNFINGF